MSDDTREVTQPQQRSVSVQAAGDTMAEIEMMALDKARAYFGEGWRVQVEPSYRAHPVGPYDPNLETYAGWAHQDGPVPGMIT
jgi:hypothetical protein